MSEPDTILIVDADRSQAQLLARAINEKLRYKTMIATSGEQAVNILLPATSTPGLMLLDMRVLQIDAIHVVSIVKHYKPDLPIIIIIEYGGNEAAIEAINVGANDFIIKPLTIERLGLSIANVLRIRHLCKMIEKLEKQLEVDGVVKTAFGMNVSRTILTGEGVVKKLRHLEEDAIRHAINACGGSMSKAARSLGIGRSTLYRKVGELERHKKQLAQISRESQTTLPTTTTSEAWCSYVE